MEKLVWKIEKRNLRELNEWEENPRTITDEGLKKLRERILARGFHDILKIDIDNTVLSGNRRRGVLLELGYEEVDVKVPNRKLSEEERAKVALESNLQDGDWDFEQLLNFDEDILKDVGWEDEELMMLFGLSDVEKSLEDLDRMNVLMILPPESIVLREKLFIKFDNISDYRKVKKAFEDGQIDQGRILDLL